MSELSARRIVARVSFGLDLREPNPCPFAAVLSVDPQHHRLVPVDVTIREVPAPRLQQACT